jgi:hypothetical protein
MVRFLFLAVFALLVFGGLALVGYALFFDLPPPSREIVEPVEIR